MTNSDTWQLDERSQSILDAYGDRLTNTGGNPPAELLERLATEKHLAQTNMPVFTLAACIKAQVSLLRVLINAGLLPAEPTNNTKE